MYSALEQHRLAQAADLLEHFKVLHVARADLQDVHIFKQGDLGGVHDLADDGQARQLLGLEQQLDAVAMEALEGIGGGAGLEGAAAQDGGARGLDGLGHGADLLLALHRAGARHHGEMAAADLHAAHVHHGVLGVELAVGVFKGLLDALHVLHDIQGAHHIHIHLRGVAHQADDGLLGAYGDMGLHAQGFQPGREVFQLFGVGIFFQQYYHDVSPPKFSLWPGNKKGSAANFAAEPGLFCVMTGGLNKGSFFLQQNSNKPYQKT